MVVHRLLWATCGSQVALCCQVPHSRSMGGAWDVWKGACPELGGGHGGSAYSSHDSLEGEEEGKWEEVMEAPVAATDSRNSPASLCGLLRVRAG